MDFITLSETAKRMVIVCISTVVFIIDTFGRLMMVLLGRKSAARCVVLYYHEISKKHQLRFARQMEVLLKFSQSIPCIYAPSFKAGNRYACITFDDGFISFKEVALPELEKRNIPATVFITTQYVGNAPGWFAHTSERLMTPAEIKEIAKNTLVEIGSHGVSHKPFTQMLPEEAQQEFIDSKRILESIIGKKITLFSFPHGAYSKEHLRLSRDAGYAKIFTIQPTLAFAKHDEYVTGRVKTGPADWPIEFVLKTIGAYRWLPYAYRLKRKIYAVSTNNRRQLLHSQERVNSASIGKKPQ